MKKSQRNWYFQFVNDNKMIWSFGLSLFLHEIFQCLMNFFIFPSIVGKKEISKN